MLAYAGKDQLKLEHLALNQLIVQTTDLLKVSISKQVELRLQLQTDLPAITADATQLRQVLMNLVINASEAIGNTPGTVSVSTGVAHADRAYLDGAFVAPDLPIGDYVYLEVTDTGQGMSAETQAKIFEPFFSTKFTGRGLGLAAVLGIVRGHHGALKVYSELGQGSSFKILLPVGQTKQRATRPARTIPTPFKGQGTILVVDDEERLRALLSHMIRIMGFRVLTACDGRDALAVYQEHRSEVTAVLMDLTMPKLDGEQAFRALREIDPHVRVLLMSGYNEQESLSRFGDRGLAGFINKPFTYDRLAERLSAILQAPAELTRARRPSQVR